MTGAAPPVTYAPVTHAPGTHAPGTQQGAHRAR